MLLLCVYQLQKIASSFDRVACEPMFYVLVKKKRMWYWRWHKCVDSIIELVDKRGVELMSLFKRRFLLVFL